MVAIHEALAKCSAENPVFYEDEVDNAVSQLSSLMEPIIMVVLGSIIGVILVAMYLPLFNLGSVVG